MSRYIFTDVSNVNIYETLLAVALITIVGSWYVSKIRLGFALRAIGEDETVARHTGINTTRVKVVCFALSASVMALVGAVLALRYPYIDATIAFNNTWSFQVLIAALLGGPGRAWGPGGRRDSAGAALRVSRRHLPASFQHRARAVLRGDRLFPAGRRRAADLERLYHAWRAAAGRKRERTDGRVPAKSCSASAACARHSAVWSPCATFPSTSRKAGSSA